ncbi:30S ribosomal protein S17 [Mameliella sediminis]|uniref:30S ribosomal protein S17 n=1 Tax=Mameliella sediminis TaxID=2836866 RepID=UPI001C46370B|nr:30S ribosomal protein S17 [Mameliella sediminis]MBY6117142.1 30S ribosomal protein S17 [Antarctobacter heliothermus]MBY6146964.1 30S ribosomal protein S17 [Mameliella alba]MBV7395572.1 30S ribosomal protein S17 [Mameliella sediminis]MBY6163942.1 30S ribosomal protein S17 [Mameliella alba]MBY6172415.1 30S ribosomal protein S17 [Mameliella alba]
MPKRILQGTVTSTANKQTVTVQVVRRFKHPVLQKTIKKSKKYRAHDENEQFNVGDSVLIRECAPKSKTKRWEVMTEEMQAEHEKQRAEAAAAAQQAEAEAAH